MPESCFASRQNRRGCAQTFPSGGRGKSRGRFPPQAPETNSAAFFQNRLSRTLCVRDNLKPNCMLRLRGNSRVSSALFGRNAKPKIFLCFFVFSAGIWEPTKNGKEIFGFASLLFN